MTLPGYVARLFFGAWASITLLLAVLFNFIEFFEKLARVKNISVGHIFQFLGLNFLPSAFDVMPVSVWLATLFVLRELTMQQSWDFLQLIGFIPYRLSLLLFLLTVGMAIGVGLLREGFVLEVAQMAEQYKYVHFKKQRQELMFGTWFELEGNRFCYIEELDCAKSKGKGVLLVTLNTEHTVTTVTHALQCTLDSVKHAVQLEHAVTVYVPEQRLVREVSHSVLSHYFFNVMNMKQRVYNLAYLYKTLMFSAYMPQPMVRALRRRLIDSLWYYISFLGYPLMTIYMFSLPLGLCGRWVMALLPYPVMITAGIFLGGIVAAGISWLYTALLVIFLLVFILRRKQLVVASWRSQLFKP